MDEHDVHNMIEDGEPVAPGVTVYRTSTCAVVVLAGEIDLATAPPARAAVNGALAAEPATPVVVDLAGVTLLSSKGIELLVHASGVATTRGTGLRVVPGTHRGVLLPLRIAGLDTTLDLYPTLQRALDGR